MGNIGTNNGNTTFTPLNAPQQQQAAPGNELLQQLLAGAAPQLASGDLQLALGQQQLSLYGPEVGAQQAYNTALAGYQGQQIGLSNQKLGIQQTALQQQGAQQQAQQGFEQQQYGLQQGQYPEQYAEAQLAYQNAMMNTQGQQAISGTQNTVGGKQDISTLNQNYGFQKQDIARAQALSQLGQQSELSGYQYSQEQLQNAGQQLNLMAQANGISQQQMLTMLNYGNQQAGLGAQQDIISLLSSMAGTAGGQVSAAGAALSPIGFASGANALAGQG